MSVQPKLAILCVTWNKQEDAARVLREAAESGPGGDGPPLEMSGVHAVLVDNASEPSFVSVAAEALAPEWIVENRATSDGPPQFEQSCTGQSNTLGLASLTIVRSGANLGGCGGFNTAMRYATGPLEQRAGRFDLLWMLDDDILLPKTTLPAMLAAMEDSSGGLVGARAVDAGDRETTFETTIYFDHRSGLLAPDPAADDPRRADHDAWSASVGGTRGGTGYSGTRSVDVVSACCLLASREVIDQIGLWDTRYFLYGDDADWSLRAGAAGFRVVCALDAVVYHTPWFSKLTPGRAYLAERNLLWTLGKRAGGRKLLMRRSIGLLRRAVRELAAGETDRAWYSGRSVLDAALNRGGGPAVPPPRVGYGRAAALLLIAGIGVLRFGLLGTPGERR